jgi:hypothetical protein
VQKAARHCRLPQSTLQRVVTGKRPPSLAVAQKIVAAYEGIGLTMDWLVSGKGSPPRGLVVKGEQVDDPVAVSAVLALHTAVQEATLSDSPAAESLNRVWWLAAYVATDASIALGKPPNGAAGLEHSTVKSRALAAVAEGWARALQTLTDAYGRDAVSHALARHWWAVLCLDADFIEWLTDGPVPLKQLDDWHDEYRRGRVVSGQQQQLVEAKRGASRKTSTRKPKS